MKKLVILFILIFSLSFVINVKSQSDIKSELLNKNTQDYQKIMDKKNKSLNDTNLTKTSGFKIKGQNSIFKDTKDINSTYEEELIIQKRTQFKKRFDHILQELNEFIEKNKSEKVSINYSK